MTKTKRLFRFAGAIIAIFVLGSCEGSILSRVQSDVQAALADAAPQIVLKQGTAGIANGGTYDFGPVLSSSPREVSFVIENRGDRELELTGVTEIEISGADAASFLLVTSPSARIPGNSSSVFSIELTTGTVGTSYSATVTIRSNDPSVSEFTFSLAGVAASSISPGGSITIGYSDPDYVVNPIQTLHFTVTDDDPTASGIEMMISNRSDFLGAGWEPYSGFRNDWVLQNSSSDGSKLG